MTGITLREFLGVSPTLQDLLRKLLTRKREIDDNFGKVLRVALLTEAYQRKELGYAQGLRPKPGQADEPADPVQVNWAALKNEVITTTVELPSCAHSKVPDREEKNRERCKEERTREIEDRREETGTNESWITR